MKLSRKIILALAIILAAEVFAEDHQDFERKHAERCTSKKCQLPDCRCSRSRLPLREFHGHEKEIPQFITVTFDDAVTALNYEQYKELFEGLINPDNCTASGTFFVSHEYTDYAKVNALYSGGHEIALHSVTHGSGTDYWRKADEDLIMREFGNLIDILETFAQVDRNDIRGMRLPYLQLSGNNSFAAAKRLGLLYDSSWPTLQHKMDGMWPYTLDYQSTQDCQITPCPDVSIPGFWINPMVMWTDTEGYGCSMIDACVNQPADEVDALFDWMVENFNRHYNGSRSPFGMYLHAAWFARAVNNFAAFKKFLQYVNTLPNVYITTPSRVIEYLRHPVLGTPFEGCLEKPKTTCLPQTCPLQKDSQYDVRYLTLCGQCPETYPWLDNPLGYI